MWTTNKTRYVGTLLLALFVGSSLVSPNLFVLCAGGEDSARIGPFHLSHGICLDKSLHQCMLVGNTIPEFTHRHVRCTSFDLSGRLGLVKERERLTHIVCLAACGSPSHAGDPARAARLVGTEWEEGVSEFQAHASSMILASVVLLI